MDKGDGGVNTRQGVLEATARAIIDARSTSRCIEAPFDGQVLDESEAYGVQRLVVADRLARGERPAGWKLGYTSAAMREQMGIAQPNFAPLTDAMLLDDGAWLPEHVIQPRVEPEIALVLATAVTSEADVARIAAHVARARAALEIVDSVWCDYRFTWADNTADGSSAAFVVLGADIDLSGVAAAEAVLSVNGQEMGRGLGAAAMGSPIDALAWLAARLLERGTCLAAGDVVITGGLTRAVGLGPGEIASATVGGTPVSVRRAAPAGDGDRGSDILWR